VDPPSVYRARSIFRSVSGKGLSAIVLWGASFVLTRLALRSFNPFGLVAVRLLAGTLLLWSMVQVRGGPVLPVRADAPVCVLLGLILSVHLLIQAYGLEYTSAINTGWIIGFIPVSIALGAHWLRQQRIGRMGWSGVVLGACGVLIVTMSSPPDFQQARWGNLLQFSSCLTWTVYTLVGAIPAARSGALRVTTVSMGVAALVVTMATMGTGVLRSALTLPAVLAMAFLGFLCSGLAYYLWFQAVTEHGPARIGALLYLEPFVTLGTAAAILGEPITVHVILGGPCVLAGVWLVAKGSCRP
jgi:drug/metabolite transporter (DMT)-like permease